MSDWFWIWFWYVLTVLIVWLILSLTKSIGMKSSVAFFIASIFGLVVALILIPYYRKPVMTAADESAMTSLVVVATLVPIFSLIYIAATGEGRSYWERGMRGFKKDARYLQVEAVCDQQLNCALTKVVESSPEGKATVQFIQ